MKHLTHEEREAIERGERVLKRHQDDWKGSDNQEIKDLLVLIESLNRNQKDAYQADDVDKYFIINSMINDHYEELDWLIANN